MKKIFWIVLVLIIFATSVALAETVVEGQKVRISWELDGKHRNYLLTVLLHGNSPAWHGQYWNYDITITDEDLERGKYEFILTGSNDYFSGGYFERAKIVPDDGWDVERKETTRFFEWRVTLGDWQFDERIAEGNFSVTPLPREVYDSVYAMALEYSQRGKGDVIGRVLDISSKPIQGVAVRARLNVSNEVRRVLGNEFLVASDGFIVPTEITTGVFRLPQLLAGVYTIYYDAPGFLSQTQVIEVRENQITTPPTVIMSRPSGEIHGWVVDETGRGIPGTCIRINNTLMPTQPNGEFRFTLVHPGIYTIYYDAPGYIGQIQEYITVTQGVTEPPRVIMSAVVTTAPVVQTVPQVAPIYTASRLRAPFHYSSCYWAQKIADYNRQWFNTREEAIAAGHRPCRCYSDCASIGITCPV